MRRCQVFILILVVTLLLSGFYNAKAQQIQYAEPVPNASQCSFTTWWNMEMDGNTFQNIAVDNQKTASFILNIASYYAYEVTMKVSTDQTITFSKIQFDMPKYGFVNIKVTITQPKKTGNQNFSTWVFKVISSCGKTLTITFRVKYPEQCCEFSTSWTKDPSSFQVRENKSATFELNINSKCLDGKIKLDLSSSKEISFTPSNFYLYAGKTQTVKITIIQPKRDGATKSSWDLTIKTSCGTTKLMKFTVGYQ